jgi:hypothetical protein
MSGAIGRPLPYARRAVVKDDKITGYLLNPSQPDNKADFFERFGFRFGAWRRLRDVLKEHPIQNMVVGVYPDEYGTLYEVQCMIPSPDGRNPCIRSFWIINNGGNVPKLVSAYARP